MISKRLYFSFLFFSTSIISLADYWQIDSVSIQGNKRTREITIKRELLFREGQTYFRDSLPMLKQRSEQRLMNLNLFNSVTISFDSSENIGILRILLVEKWYIWPIPTVEFADRNFNIWADSSFDPHRTNYGLYLFNYNLFGLNQTLKASIIGGYNTKLALEYRIPFLGTRFRNTGIKIRTAYTSQDELWARTENDRLQFYQSDDPDFVRDLDLNFEISQRIKLPLTIWAGLSFRNTRLNEEALDHSEEYLLNNALMQNLYQAYLGSSYDKRDNIFLPLDGYFIETLLHYQQFMSDDKLLNLKWEGKAQTFIPLAGNFRSAFSAYGIYNSAEGLPYRYQRILGYDYLLRGYERNVIDGQYGFLLNAALRYQMINQMISLKMIPFVNYKTLPVMAFLEFFLDAGQANSRNRDFFTSNKLYGSYLYSTGLSLQMLFYNDRLVRFEYSLNAEGNSGFYFHFKKAI